MNRAVIRRVVAILATLALAFGVAISPAHPQASPYSNFLYKPQVFTASGQTGTPIQLNGLTGTSLVGSSFSSGTITLNGTSLTAVTFQVRGSSDNGATYYPLALVPSATPTATPSTVITATAPGLYRVDLGGITHVEFVTSGTFGATNVTLALTASPNSIAQRGSGGGTVVTRDVITSLGPLMNDTSGNAASATHAQTATALASTPSLCSSGYAPTGVDVQGNAMGCAATGGGSAVGPTNYIGMFNGTGSGGQSALGGIATTSDTTSTSVKIANRWTAHNLAGANEADTYPDPSDSRISAWHGIMTALAATQGGLVDVPPDYQALNGTPWFRLDGQPLWNDGTALIDRRYGIESKTFFNPTNIPTNNELHAGGSKTCVFNSLVSHVTGDPNPTTPGAAALCDSLNMTSSIGGWNYGGGNVYNSSLVNFTYDMYSQGIGNTLTANCNHYGNGDNNCMQAVVSTLFGNSDGSAEGDKTHRDQVDQASPYRATVSAIVTNTYGQSVLTLANYGSNTIGAGHNIINTTPAKMYTANWIYNSSVNGPNSFAIMDLSNIQLGGVAVTSVPVSVCSTIAVGGGPVDVVPNDGTQSTALVLNNPLTGAFNTTDVMFLENDDVPEQVTPTAVTVGSTTTTVQVQLRGYHPAGEFLCQGALAAYAANMVSYSGAGSRYVQYITGSISPTQVRVGYYRAGVANAFTQTDSVQFFPASTVVAPMNPNTGTVDGGSFTIQQAGSSFAPGDSIEIPVSISGMFTNHSLTAGITDPYVMSQYDNAIFPAASLVSVPMFQYYLANQIPSPGIPGIASEGGLLAPPENFMLVNGVFNQGFHFLHPPESSLVQVDAPDATSTVKNFDLFQVDGTALNYTFATNSFWLNKGGQTVTFGVNGAINGSTMSTGELTVVDTLTAHTATLLSATVNGKNLCLQDGTNCGGIATQPTILGYNFATGTVAGAVYSPSDGNYGNFPSITLATGTGNGVMIDAGTAGTGFGSGGHIALMNGNLELFDYRSWSATSAHDFAFTTSNGADNGALQRLSVSGGADVARVTVSNAIMNIPLTTPASSSAACNPGDFTDDANFHYACVAANTWKRIAYLPDTW